MLMIHFFLNGSLRGVFMVFVCVYRPISGKWDAEFTKLTSEKEIIKNPLEEENLCPLLTVGSYWFLK